MSIDCRLYNVSSIFSAGGGKCLENAPPIADFVYPEDLPGQTHDADYQCKLQFFSRSQSCKVSVCACYMLLIKCLYVYAYFVGL